MRPFIVAEMGASHNGSLRRAIDIVVAAKECGADAVKTQTWSTMTVDERRITSGPWTGRKLTELYEECRLPWDWHPIITAHARKIGIEWFSTPFDVESVEFLETLGCPRYKIASAEITHLDLIRHVASKGKPVIISTGMATEAEIGDAADAAVEAPEVTLLKCVASYPATAHGFNLRTMEDMRDYGCDVGISDHTLGSAVAVAAAALGATVIEKHLSLDRKGPDGGFAAMPDDFARMVSDVRLAVAALGEVKYGPTDSERDTLQFRRSLWITTDVAVGAPITPTNVAVLRPIGGMPPRDLARVHARRAARALRRGEPLTEDMLA